jgi:AcrR family transcriptional regulator
MSRTKGEETRHRIVQAAWGLSSARGIEQLLCGVSLREVAGEAGLTPSAVSYHFPTMRDLALGMVGAFVDSLSPLATDSVEAVFEQVESRSLAEMVREAAAANWAVLTSDEEVEFEKRLTRCYSATGAAGDGPEVRRALARFNDHWLEQLTRTYERAAAAAGMRPVEPFTFDEIARAVAGMSEGLLHQWMCDRDGVRVDLVADMAVVLASVVLTPVGRSVGIEELSTRLPNRPGAALPADGRVHAAAEVAALFSGGYEQVTLTQVGDALGWSPEDVHARLGSVRRVAALSFARHLPVIEAAACRRRDVGGAVALSDALFELARCVAADRWCAVALQVERLESRADSSAGPGEGVGDLMSLTSIFAALLGAFDGGVLDVGDAAEMMVDTVLTCGATRSGVALSSVVDAALRIGAPGCLTSPDVGR